MFKGVQLRDMYRLINQSLIFCLFSAIVTTIFILVIIAIYNFAI